MTIHPNQEAATASRPAAASDHQNGTLALTRRLSHLPIRSRTEMTTISGRPSWPRRAATRGLRTSRLEQRIYRRCEQSAPALAVHSLRLSGAVMAPLPGYLPKVVEDDASIPGRADGPIFIRHEWPVESGPKGRAMAPFFDSGCCISVSAQHPEGQTA